MFAAALLGIAAAGVVARMNRERRRRRRIADALHELRRPLQQLLLDRGDAGGFLDAAADAAAELERVVHGDPRRRRRAPIAAVELVAALESRWRGRLAVSGAPRSELVADRAAISAALDNLVANGLEHGMGEAVDVEAREEGRWLRLSVSNRAGCRSPDDPRSAGPGRGRGLRIAGTIAREHGGTLDPPTRRGDLVVTDLRLPRGTGERR